MAKAAVDKPESELEAKPEPKPDSTPVAKPEFKGSSKPESKDDLKSAAHAGTAEKVGVVAGRPQSGRSAETADTIWAERDRGKENQSVPEVPHLFLGPHSVDD